MNTLWLLLVTLLVSSALSEANNCTGPGSEYHDVGPDDGYEWGWRCTNNLGRGAEYAQLFTPSSLPWTYTDICVSYYGAPVEPWLALYENDEANDKPGALLEKYDSDTGFSMPTHAGCEYTTFSGLSFLANTTSTVWLAVRIGDCFAGDLSPRICHTEDYSDYPGFNRQYDVDDGVWYPIDTFCHNHGALAIRATGIGGPVPTSQMTPMTTVVQLSSSMNNNTNEISSSTLENISTSYTGMTWWWQTIVSSSGISSETSEFTYHTITSNVATLDSSSSGHNKPGLAIVYTVSAIAGVVAIALIVLFCVLAVKRIRAVHRYGLTKCDPDQEEVDFELDVLGSDETSIGGDDASRMKDAVNAQGEGLLENADLTHEECGGSHSDTHSQCDATAYDDVKKHPKIDPSKFGFELTPSILEFVGTSGKLDVNVSHTMQATLKNLTILRYTVQVITPTSSKMTVTVMPTDAELNGNSSIDFNVSVKPLCGAKQIDVVICLLITCMSKSKKKRHLVSKMWRGCQKGVPATIRLPIQASPDPLSGSLDDDEVHYKQKDYIGQGSFGTVYKGTWRQQTVAIKVMKAQQLSGTALKDFATEAAALYKTRHENIVRFIGAVCIPGQLKLVTEYLPLGSLERHLHDHRVPNQFKLRMALDVAKGIQFLHECDIVHRDLKPGNMLVVSLSEGATTYIKITDFGSTRTIVKSNTTASMTKGIGTPIYMAPEMRVRVEEGQVLYYGTATDIFSFAVSLYEMYMEKTPYSDDSRFVYDWSIAKFVDEGKRLEIPDEWPQCIRDLILLCWQQNPSDRPDADLILQKIETHLSIVEPKGLCEKEKSC